MRSAIETNCKEKWWITQRWTPKIQWTGYWVNLYRLCFWQRSWTRWFLRSFPTWYSMFLWFYDNSDWDSKKDHQTKLDWESSFQNSLKPFTGTSLARGVLTNWWDAPGFCCLAFSCCWSAVWYCLPSKHAVTSCRNSPTLFQNKINQVARLQYVEVEIVWSPQ